MQLPLVLLGMLGGAAAGAAPRAIVLVIADDYGWSNIDMEGHNKNVRTPNFNQLSREGVRLDRHYVYKYCSPTRSSLLTGRLPIHVNQNNEGNLLSSRSGADIRMATLPQKLKLANPPFATHLLGKWHCGARSLANLPINRGYDTHLGFLKGAEDHFTQQSNFDGYAKSYLDLWQDHHPASNDLNGTYSVLRDAARAVQIIRNHDSGASSLFLDVRFQTTHNPYQVPEYYENAAIDNEDGRTIEAMSFAMDEAVGNITAALKDKGLWEETLLIFTADNGGLTHGNGAGNNYPLRGGKTSDFEGGVRVAAFMSGGYVPVAARGSVHTGLLHIADWYATLSNLVGVDPTDSAAAPSWQPKQENWNCGDEAGNVLSRDDSGLDREQCLDLCQAYDFAGHWTAGATTCRCYQSCEAGHDTAAGVTNEVYRRTPGVPPVDGVDQWASLITPNAATSARQELPLAFCSNLGGASDDCVSTSQGLRDLGQFDQGALITDGGRWKVVFGDQFGFGFFTGPLHPNGTKNYKDAGCPEGCLFDLFADPTEHVDVKEREPEVFARLKARLQFWGRTVFQTSYSDVPDSQCLSPEAAGAKYNGHIGPQCLGDSRSVLV